MQEAENTSVVQSAYAAFGRGDVDGILNTLTDDVIWKPVMGAGKDVPNAGERRGKPAVREFFKITAESYQFSRFEPQEFVAQGDKVVTLGHYTATTPLKKTIDSDFVMVFTLKNGKVSQFQEFADAAQLNAAFAK